MFLALVHDHSRLVNHAGARQLAARSAHQTTATVQRVFTSPTVVNMHIVAVLVLSIHLVPRRDVVLQPANARQKVVLKQMPPWL